MHTYRMMQTYEMTLREDGKNLIARFRAPGQAVANQVAKDLEEHLVAPPSSSTDPNVDFDIGEGGELLNDTGSSRCRVLTHYLSYLDFLNHRWYLEEIDQLRAAWKLGEWDDPLWDLLADTPGPSSGEAGITNGKEGPGDESTGPV